MKGSFNLYWKIIFVVLLVAIVVSLPLYIYSNNETTNVCAQSQNIYLIKQASIIIPSNFKGDKLNSIAAKVQSLPGYDRDPNCLYIMFKQAEFTSNFSKAQSYLDKIKTHYNIKTGLSKYFGYGISLASMQSNLDLYKRMATNKPGDFSGFTRPQ